MHIKQNAQNVDDVKKCEKKYGQKVAASERRFQPDLHPVLIEMVAYQDERRFHDLRKCETGALPQVHSVPLRDDVQEMGSYEPNDPLLSSYGYVRPAASYEGAECRIDDSTWLTTTPLAMQHTASLANCALAQNSALQYCCDAVMAQFNTHQRELTHPIDALHVYFAQLTRLMQQVALQQAAQLTALAQHSKYTLRDAITRCCAHDVRRDILSQPLFQGDRLWEEIDAKRQPRTFPEWMERENLRPAPPIVAREIEREDRSTFGLASPHPVWMADEKVAAAHQRVLRRQRSLFAVKQKRGTVDPLFDHDPDDRTQARYPSDLRPIEEVMASIMNEQVDLDVLKRQEQQEADDSDFLVSDDATSEDDGDSSSLSDSDEAQTGTASGRKPRRRRERLPDTVTQEELERLVKEAGPRYVSLPAECPPELTVEAAYALYGIPPADELKFLPFVRKEVLIREAEIAAWHRNKELEKATAPDSTKRKRVFHDRAPKRWLPKLQRNLLPPTTREDHERLQLQMRRYVRAVAPLVAQDEALVHQRTKTKAPTTPAVPTTPLDQLAARKARKRMLDRRRRRITWFMAVVDCTREEAEAAARKEEMEAERARLQQEEDAALAAAAAAPQVAPVQPQQPSAPSEAASAAAPATATSTKQEATAGGAGDATSGAKKHRHDDASDVEVRVKPQDLDQLLAEGLRRSDIEETSPEVSEAYDEYEGDGTRRKKLVKRRPEKRRVHTHTSSESSQDDPTPDASVHSADLKPGSQDSCEDSMETNQLDTGGTALQAGQKVGEVVFDQLPQQQSAAPAPGTSGRKSAPRKPPAKKPRQAPTRRSSRKK